MRAWWLVVVSACWRAPAAERPVVQPIAAPEPGAPTIFVGACNSDCTGCSLGDYQSYVAGTIDRTGAQVFPTPDPPVPGYSCSAQVSVGERITLRARSASGLAIQTWRTADAGDYCPCASGNVCSFVVTSELVKSYTRVYCGAVWAPKPTLQLGP